METPILEVLGNILIIFLVISVHELGHLVAGLIQGFRFELFVIGPLGIKRENTKIKIYLNKNVQYYGGVASTIPINDNPDNSKKFANLLLAGPIASILLSIFLGSLYIFIEFQFSKTLMVGTMASFAIFLATTIPSKTGVFFTDRKRYQRLTSEGDEKEVELAVLRVIGVYGRDDSYLKADPRDIELMIKDEDYNYFGLFTKLSYQFSKNGNFEVDTKNEFELISKKMPRSLVKTLNKELDTLSSN